MVKSKLWSNSMSIRGQRVGRNQQEKNAYFNAIKNTESTSTVVEKSSILPSDQEGEDEAIVTTNTKRPVDNSAEIIDWIINNWIKVSIGLIAAAGFYFVNESKNSFYKVDATLQEHSKSINQIQIDVKDLSKLSQEQFLKSQRTEDKLEGLNQRISDINLIGKRR